MGGLSCFDTHVGGALREKGWKPLLELHPSHSSLSHLHKDVSRHGGAGHLRAAEPPDEHLSRTHAVIVQQESEDGAVS